MLRIARILQTLAALASGWMAAPAWALDQDRIHAEYNNGDFESVTQELEKFVADNRVMSHDDSVFVCKHLAVVYSATPETRERGKFYMYKLLELMPYAQLVDMFVSEEINRIFERVRAEFSVRQKALGKGDPYMPVRSEAEATPMRVVPTPRTGNPEATASQPAPRLRSIPVRMAQPMGDRSQGLRILSGYRFLPGSPWRSLQQQAMAGVGWDLRPWAYPFGITARALYSRVAGTVRDPSGIMLYQRLRTDAFEADIGFKAMAEGLPFFQPFVEAGEAYYRSVLLDDTGGAGFSAADWAPWIGGGVQCTLFRHATLAFQIDRTFADIRFENGVGGGRPLAMMLSAGIRW